MSIETIIIIVLIALILYELKRIAKCLVIREQVNSPTDSSIKSDDDYEKYSALYPVFSEQAINHACKRFSKYHNELVSKWNELHRLEIIEAKKHHESGMDASTFNPPLRWLLEEINFIAVSQNNTENDLKKMIETNIRALNGMNIEQARKEYEDRRTITKIEDESKLFIRDYKKSWLKRWGNLIKKEEDGK